MSRIAAVILAFAVCAANTFCACTAAAGSASRSVAATARTERQERHHECCVPAHPSTGDRQHDNHGRGNGHTCPHCTGSFTGDSSTAKTTLAQPAPVPDLFLPVCLWLAPHDSDSVVRPRCFGLPPPLDPPTLFNQSCLLTT